MKIGLVTDSIARVNEQRAIDENIKVAYLNVIVDGKSYKEVLEISNQEVFKYVEQGKKVTTSQPTPEDFVKQFEDLKAEGHTDILCIVMSSVISGTYQAANIAKSMVEGVNIQLFDSLSSGLHEELFIDKALEMIKAGKNIDEIIEHITYLRKESKIRIVIDDLNALYRGGRLSKSQAIVGNFIKMKPILTLMEGEIKLIGKIRTKKKAITNIVDEIKEDYIKKGKLVVHITHINSPSTAEYIKKKVAEISSLIKIKLCEEIGPVHAVHFGDGGYAIAWTVDQ